MQISDAGKWLKKLAVIFTVMLLMVIGVIAYVDPFFHYHKPHTDRFYYDLFGDYKRYYNDGILRHFDYDTVIIGTSLTDFISAAKVDELFECRSVKTPFSGGEYAEIRNHLETAFKDHNVRYVFRPLDIQVDSILITEDLHSDELRYLFNDNPFDDVYYVLNKEVLFESARTVADSLKSSKTGILSFDDYCDWYNPDYYTKERAMTNVIVASPEEQNVLTEQEEILLRENIQKNVTDTAAAHPETIFYYFIPPYSVANWSNVYSSGNLEKRIQEERIMLEMILEQENIHLYSFTMHTDWTCNLLNYCDRTHYSPEITNLIIDEMKEDHCRLTKDNYESYLEEEYQFYLNFDYSSLLD